MSEQSRDFHSNASRRNAILLEQMRQHVNNLMAAAYLLTPVVRGSGEAKCDRYLAIMNQSFYRLLRLMNHMELAQDQELGGIPFHPGALDLAGLCRETADETAPLAKMAGVTFRYESEFTSLPTTGDSALLRRLLLGLFSNAVKAAGEGGEAGLRLSKQKNRAVLTVWDNGPGLEEEDAAEPLYRPEGGMGLGLDIVRELARLHGGAVMLESRQARGMRSVVSLPIKPPEPGGAPAADSRLVGGGGFSPVLVELADLLPYEAFMPDDLE